MESNDVEGRCRSHFDRTYGRRGYTFSRYLPAYHYGAGLAQQPRFVDRAWSHIEEDVRRDWESRDAGPWLEFRDAVRYAWEADQPANQSNRTVPPSGPPRPEGPHTDKRHL